MSMTHQQLMAMSKEQLVQAYEQLQELHTSQMANLNRTVSNLEHDFAVAKRKLEDEIAALKTKNEELVKKNAELVKTIAALKAKN